MKKIIIFSVLILSIGLTGIFSLDTTTNKVKRENKNSGIVKLNESNESKENSIAKTEVKQEDKQLYSNSVPVINQDYTIDSKDNSSKEKIVNNDSVYLENINNNEIVKENEETISSPNIDENNEEQEENLEDTNLNEEEILVKDEVAIEEAEEVDNNKLENNNELENDIKVENDVKNGFYEEGENTYYYENDVKVTGLKNINGVNNYFSPSGKYLGTNNIKVIDVSYYQGDINWDLFASESDCYGVILRLGYYQTLDKKFERNINELKRLNIPYGIYLFSYSTTLSGTKKEADFTNSMISKYNLNPTLGIYYDIESWSSSNGSSSNEITKEMYDNIVQSYINSVSYYTNYKYKVKVYSGRWYAMNKLGEISKKHVDWVAEYNSTCKYDGVYSIWQYTSKGSVPGIEGNVDISYIL